MWHLPFNFLLWEAGNHWPCLHYIENYVAIGMCVCERECWGLSCWTSLSGFKEFHHHLRWPSNCKLKSRNNGNIIKVAIKLKWTIRNHPFLMKHCSIFVMTTNWELKIGFQQQQTNKPIHFSCWKSSFHSHTDNIHSMPTSKVL